MTVGEGDTGLVFLNGKDIFSLKTEELKAELDGSFENEALENEDRSTKHPNLENEAP